jgi:uncharacterized protein YqeY
MSFTDKINKETLAALRDIKSKLLLESTSGSGNEVSEETAMKICMKLHKQRVETYDLYIAQGREDLAADELFQAKVIEAYLPKQLSAEEILQEVKLAIETTGASSPQEMGKVMGVLQAKLSGKADGKLIAQFVKEELAK